MSGVDWMKQARCVQVKAGPSVFFPDKSGPGGARKAKVVCSGCHVRDFCLAYALFNREMDGIWGGLSDRERRAILKRLGGTRAIRREGSVEAVAEKLRLAVAV